MKISSKDKPTKIDKAEGAQAKNSFTIVNLKNMDIEDNVLGLMAK